MRGDLNQVWFFGKPYLWEIDGRGHLFLRRDRIQILFHSPENRRRHRQFILEEKFSTEVGLGKSQLAAQASLYTRALDLSEGSW